MATLARKVAAVRTVATTVALGHADRVGGGAVAQQSGAATRVVAETLMGMGAETVLEEVAPGVEAPGVGGGRELDQFPYVSANALGTPETDSRITRTTSAVTVVGACIAARFGKTTGKANLAKCSAAESGKMGLASSTGTGSYSNRLGGCRSCNSRTRTRWRRWGGGGIPRLAGGGRSGRSRETGARGRRWCSRRWRRPRFSMSSN